MAGARFAPDKRVVSPLVLFLAAEGRHRPWASPAVRRTGNPPPRVLFTNLPAIQEPCGVPMRPCIISSSSSKPRSRMRCMRPAPGSWRQSAGSSRSVRYLHSHYLLTNQAGGSFSKEAAGACHRARLNLGNKGPGGRTGGRLPECDSRRNRGPGAGTKASPSGESRSGSAGQAVRPNQQRQGQRKLRSPPLNLRART